MSQSRPNFTPRALHALAFAGTEAARLKNDCVSVEHLLLGLIRVGQGAAATFLQKHGLNLENTRHAVENQVGAAPENKPACRLPYTPRAKRVLELAAKHAVVLNHTFVGTEHILMALLAEDGGVAAVVFRHFNIESKEARLELLKELAPNYADVLDVNAVELEQASAELLIEYDQDPPALSSFTPPAQQALALARSEADRLRHGFVGTEHLLLGLMSLGKGVFFKAFVKAGLDLENVHKEIEGLVGVGLDQRTIRTIPYSPFLKKVLALAAKEAKWLNHTYVGTEHLLLGLLREEQGTAARVFQSLKVNIEETRHEILRELGGI